MRLHYKSTKNTLQTKDTCGHIVAVEKVDERFVIICDKILAYLEYLVCNHQMGGQAFRKIYWQLWVEFTLYKSNVLNPCRAFFFNERSHEVI